jgi:hypothetical protein
MTMAPPSRPDESRFDLRNGVSVGRSDFGIELSILDALGHERINVSMDDENASELTSLIIAEIK